MGKAKASKSRPKELFAKSRGVNLLAAARVVLFGARDVWFSPPAGLPLSTPRAGPSRWWAAFLAFWTIVYGVVQAAAPALIRRSADGLSTEVPAARSLVPCCRHWYLRRWRLRCCRTWRAA